MPDRTPRAASRPSARISGPAELVQAVPYLLGFVPRRSLVLVGLTGGLVAVTARLDLDDVEGPPGRALLASTVAALRRGGVTAGVCVVWDDDARPFPFGPPDPDDDPLGLLDPDGPGTPPMPWCDVVDALAEVLDADGCELREAVLLAGMRWWSYLCAPSDCCPLEGNPVPTAPSSFAAAATVEGVVALEDRAAMVAQLDPEPGREALEPALEAAEHAAVDAALRGRARAHRRAVSRALTTAAHASADARWTRPPDDELARFGAALLEDAVRGPLWLEVDDRRLDGRPLWRTLGRALPAPYDAAPLLLYGWASWRAGSSALAGVAAERALASDPTCTAAELLLSAVTHGLDPRRAPRLRSA